MGFIKKPSLINYIHRRIENNQNFICVVIGKTGSGKSYTCMSLGEKLDSKMNIKRVAFSPLQFMKLLTEGDLKKGSVVIMEELGVLMNARNFQSVNNKLINSVMQSFRHRNIILLMNVPSKSFIDSATRKLLHCTITTEHIDRKNNTVICKPILHQLNEETGKVYNKYLRVVTSKGVVPIKRIRVSMPSKLLSEQYEQEKRKFTDNLNLKVLKELENIDNPQKEAKERPPLTVRQEEIFNSLKDGLLIPEIMNKLSLSIDVVYFHIKQIKKKGYYVIPIKEKQKIVSYRVE